MSAIDAVVTERLTGRRLRLGQFTVVYNVAEDVVAIVAGVLAGRMSAIGLVEVLDG